MYFWLLIVIFNSFINLYECFRQKEIETDINMYDTKHQKQKHDDQPGVCKYNDC